MIDWAGLGKWEKVVRVRFAVALAARLIECVRREDVVGAAISGLSAVGALGLSADEIRSVLSAMERAGSDADV